MKKFKLIGIVFLVLIGLFFVGYNLSSNKNTWTNRSFGLEGQPNIAKIAYPAKYKDSISDNTKLVNQKMGLFSIANIINFQLSNEEEDVDIETFTQNLQKSAPVQAVGEETKTVDTNYKTVKYGQNTVYFINEFNTSLDFISGDIFDGQGHRLNFTYHSKNVDPKEIKALISKIRF